jgi:dihydrofolate reductase
MNAMPKYVASTTLKEPAWQNTTVLQGDSMSAVERLKHELAGDLLVTGSRSLAQALRQHDLVDEYRLLVFPILLGSGQRLFEDAEDATRLQLVEALPLPNGAVALTYRVHRGAS